MQPHWKKKWTELIDLQTLNQSDIISLWRHTFWCIVYFCFHKRLLFTHVTYMCAFMGYSLCDHAKNFWQEQLKREGSS